jgi:uncharacterized lipoprotein NlpE involved in copper resistance
MNALKFLGIAAAFLMLSCTKKQNPEVNPNSQTDSRAIQTSADSTQTGNMQDWYGTYEAVIPCADCPGIKTTLTLNENRSFKLEEEYLERKSRNEDQGTYTWDAATKVITLNGNTSKYKYKVGNNTITQLDTNGQGLEGPNKNSYVFKKK